MWDYFYSFEFCCCRGIGEHNLPLVIHTLVYLSDEENH